MIQLFLPLPPSVNNYYVKTQRGQFISQKGRKFRAEVLDAVHEQTHGHTVGDERLRVEVIVHYGTKHANDLDNRMKALLDAITQTGLWDDDKQIDQLIVFRGANTHGGATQVRISAGGPKIPLNYSGDIA